MSDNSHSEKEFVQQQYEQMLQAHQQDETVLVSHYGELSQSVISNLEGYFLSVLKHCKTCYFMGKKITKANSIISSY